VFYRFLTAFAVSTCNQCKAEGRSRDTAYVANFDAKSDP
jgi:hypothetical protein